MCVLIVSHDGEVELAVSLLCECDVVQPNVWYLVCECENRAFRS